MPTAVIAEMSNAELVELVADDALCAYRGPVRGFLRTRAAVEALGNHRLAQLEDSLAAAAECDAAFRFALRLSADRPASIGKRDLRAAVSAVTGI